MADYGVQIQAAMRLAAMQEDRYRGDGHVGQRQGKHDVSPPRQWEQTLRDKRKKI